MPVIQFLETVPTPTGTKPAAGNLYFTPTGAFPGQAAGEEVIPSGFQVTLDPTGAAAVNLAPTGATWCWRVDMALSNYQTSTAYVAVKTTDTQWVGLTRVDPATLKAAPTPAWVAASASMVTSATVDPSGNLVLTRYDGSTVTAAQVSTPAAATAYSLVFGG